MKITALVENQTTTGKKTAHGLALYIETKNHKMLFDLGPDETLFENANDMGVDLILIDTVIISHGHRDHGGALGQFLELNKSAKIYIQRTAFDPHFSRPPGVVKDISLDASLMNDPRIILLEGDYKIDNELEVFTVSDRSRCYSDANNTLYAGEEKDTFRHEQYLIIHEDKTVLILGCGHTGIVNILNRAKPFAPEVCVGGYHLFNPETKKRVSDELLDEMIAEMNALEGTQFYTCHCTGQESYEYMRGKMDSMHYLSCGDSIEI